MENDNKRLAENNADNISAPVAPSITPLIIFWCIGLLLLGCAFICSSEIKIYLCIYGGMCLILSSIAYRGCYSNYRQKRHNYNLYIENLGMRQRKAKKYCEWLEKQKTIFVEKVNNEQANPSWGFELQKEHNLLTGEGGRCEGNSYIFDIPNVKGVAFDMEAKKMLYYEYPIEYYNRFENSSLQCAYNYSWIPFIDIFAVNIDVEKQTDISTVTSKENVMGRSIVGGLIAGNAGAIIGGTTGKEVSTTKTETKNKKIFFNIQTTNKRYPVISFEFFDNTSLVNTNDGLLENKREKFVYSEEIRKRECNTTVDCMFDRINVPRNKNLEDIGKIMKEYSMHIEAIIQQQKDDKQYETKDKSKDNVVDELTKLIDMKEKGLITEEEFVKIKEKLF